LQECTEDYAVIVADIAQNGIEDAM
jgi:hypothetical protein